MNPLILGPLFEAGKLVIERLFPDKEKAAQAEMEFTKMMAQGDLAIIIKQLEINAEEAKHASIWVAGWRPFFGWVGGASFAYVGLLQPMITWVARIKGWPEPPDIDTDFLWVVVSGLLGLGSLRTVDKGRMLRAKK